SAEECDDNGCNADSTKATLTLSNTAPAITSPAPAAKTGTLPTIDATTPSPGLAFFVDGTKVAFVGASPFSFTVAAPLDPRDHTIVVQECGATGTTCQGTKSVPVTFTVAQVMPSVTSASPNPFSPNNDGRNDNWSFRVHLLDSEQVSYVVQDSNAQTVA